MDILDDGSLDDQLGDDNKELQFYTYIAPEFVQTIDQLLHDNKIIFGIKPPKRTDDFIVEKAVPIVRIASNSFQLFVDYNDTKKLDELLEKNIHLFEKK